MPNPPKNQTDVALSLRRARCLKFALTAYGRANKAKIPDDRYEFSLTINLSTSKINQQINVQVNSQLFEKSNPQLKLALAEIEVSCSFFIQNFNDLLSNDAMGNLNIPDLLLHWCSNITLGAARGMFALKLEKTLYANALLPLVDMKLLKTVAYHLD